MLVGASSRTAGSSRQRLQDPLGRVGAVVQAHTQGVAIAFPIAPAVGMIGGSPRPLMPSEGWDRVVHEPHTSSGVSAMVGIL